MTMGREPGDVTLIFDGRKSEFDSGEEFVPTDPAIKMMFGAVCETLFDHEPASAVIVRKTIEMCGPFVEWLDCDESESIDVRSRGAAYKVLRNYFAGGNTLNETLTGVLYFENLSADDADAFMCWLARNPDKFSVEKSLGVRALPHIARAIGSTRKVNGHYKIRREYPLVSEWVRTQATMTYLESTDDPLRRLVDGHLWSKLFGRAIRSDIIGACEITFALRYARRKFGVRLVPDGKKYKLRGSRKASEWLVERITGLGGDKWLKAALEELSR